MRGAYVVRWRIERRQEWEGLMVSWRLMVVRWWSSIRILVCEGLTRVHQIVARAILQVRKRDRMRLTCEHACNYGHGLLLITRQLVIISEKNRKDRIEDLLKMMCLISVDRSTPRCSKSPSISYYIPLSISQWRPSTSSSPWIVLFFWLERYRTGKRKSWGDRV